MGDKCYFTGGLNTSSNTLGTVPIPKKETEKDEKKILIEKKSKNQNKISNRKIKNQKGKLTKYPPIQDPFSSSNENSDSESASENEEDPTVSNDPKTAKDLIKLLMKLPGFSNEITKRSKVVPKKQKDPIPVKKKRKKENSHELAQTSLFNNIIAMASNETENDEAESDNENEEMETENEQETENEENTWHYEM